MRKRQQQRINSQKKPSGESYTPPRRKILRTQGGVKFLWKDETRELSNWRTTGHTTEIASGGGDLMHG